MEGIVEILKHLVGFPTISRTSNDDICRYIEDRLKSLSPEIIRISSDDDPKRSNLLCKFGPDVDGGLMLSGHLDVVPVAGQNWQSDPFVVDEREGKLFGRGTADMKGFIAAVLSALPDFAHHKLTKPLFLLWTYDEEIGCVGSLKAAPLLKEHCLNLPKAALVGEPTNFNVVRMHAGHVTVKVSLKGKGAHSSDPDLGVSAIKALNEALGGIFALEDELKSEKSFAEFFKRPFVTLNVGEVHGGTAVNIIPDQAHATIGFRPLPDTNVDEIFARIVNACKAHQRDARAEIQVRLEKSSPAMITNEHTSLENLLRPLSNSDAPCAVQYSTDGGNIRRAGIDTLIWGPGSIDVAHRANEFIMRSDLEIAKQKILRLLNEWFF